MDERNKNRLLCFAALGLLILPAFLVAAESKKTPRASVLQDRYEFETVPEGTIIEYDFEIANAGSDVLSIQKTVSSCSCLTIKSYDEMIPPGETGKVSVSLDTDGYGGGVLTRRATILSNDPENASMDLVILGQVDKTYDISKEIVKLNGRAGETVSETVKIFPAEKYEFKVLGIRTKKGEYIECSFEEIVEDGRHGCLLTIEGNKKEKGLFFDKIFVDTDSTMIPELSIGVFGKIEASG